jgi:hypothetical protein
MAERQDRMQRRRSEILLNSGAAAIVAASPLQVRNEFSRSNDGIGRFREFRPDVGTHRDLFIARESVILVREIFQ